MIRGKRSDPAQIGVGTIFPVDGRVYVERNLASGDEIAAVLGAARKAQFALGASVPDEPRPGS